MLAELAAGARSYADIFGETGDYWKKEIRQWFKEVAYVNDCAKEFKVDPTQLPLFLRPQIPKAEPEPPQATGDKNGNGKAQNHRMQFVQ